MGRIEAAAEQKVFLDLQRRIVQTARVYAQRYDMPVKPSGEKGKWACGFNPASIEEVNRYMAGERPDLEGVDLRPHTIYYDLESAKDMKFSAVQTILAHEGGHALASDFGFMIMGQKISKDEGHLPTSFWLIFEGMEDPRVNEVSGRRSENFRARLIEENREMIDERVADWDKFRKLPRLFQFALASVYYWAHGEPLEQLANTDVGAVLSQARPLLDRYYVNTEPTERWELQQQIWDIAKVLEAADLNDQAFKNFCDQRNKNGQSGQGDGQQEGSDNENGNGSGNGRGGGLFRRFRLRVGGTNQGGQEQATSGDQAANEQAQREWDALPEEEKEAIRKAVKDALDERQKEILENEMPKTFILEKGEDGTYQAKPASMSEEEQQQADEAFEEAEQEVEADESEARREIERRRREAERRLAEQREREEKERMKKAGFDPEKEAGDYRVYESLEKSMLSKIRSFVGLIKGMLPRQDARVQKGAFMDGSSINMTELVRRFPVGDWNVMQRETMVPVGDPRLFIALVVDNTGSMSGEKIQEARKASIFLNAVCEQLGIPFIDIVFDSSAYVIKGYEQRFSDPRHKVKPRLIQHTTASGWSTNLHAGLKEAIDQTNLQRGRILDRATKGIVYVISDGLANSGLTGDELKNYVDSHINGITYQAIGLADEGERQMVEEGFSYLFGKQNCMFPRRFSELPDLMYHSMRRVFERYKEFIS